MNIEARADSVARAGEHGSSLSISIAMCTYNGARYLDEQLESIARQRRLPDELVIIDDNSSDKTMEILERFAADARFSVRIERNPHQIGSTANFEKAIGLCECKLICLCDQDDKWLPEKLDVLSERFDDDCNLGGLFSDAFLIDSLSHPKEQTLWHAIEFDAALQDSVLNGEVVPVLLSRGVATGATMMFRADLRSRILPIPRTWVHDEWISWIIALHSKLSLVTESLMFYRLHDNQQCGVLPATRERLSKGRLAWIANYESVLLQLEDLCRHLEHCGDPFQSRWEPQVRLKMQHIARRIMLPKSRLLRIPKLILEIENYQRFSKGWKSLLKDLVVS